MVGFLYSLSIILILSLFGRKTVNLCAFYTLFKAAGDLVTWLSTPPPSQQRHLGTRRFTVPLHIVRKRGNVKERLMLKAKQRNQNLESRDGECAYEMKLSVKLLCCEFTCLASTSSVMKKMKREIEPIVLRSLRTPGLEG